MHKFSRQGAGCNKDVAPRTEHAPKHKTASVFYYSVILSGAKDRNKRSIVINATYVGADIIRPKKGYAEHKTEYLQLQNASRLTGAVFQCSDNNTQSENRPA